MRKAFAAPFIALAVFLLIAKTIQLHSASQEVEIQAISTIALQQAVTETTYKTEREFKLAAEKAKNEIEKLVKAKTGLGVVPTQTELRVVACAFLENTSFEPAWINPETLQAVSWLPLECVNAISVSIMPVEITVNALYNATANPLGLKTGFYAEKQATPNVLAKIIVPEGSRF